MIFAAASTPPTIGLDYSYLAFVAAALLPLGLVWIYANRRLSNFNGENGEKKKSGEEQLSQDMYREATAPLVLAVNNYVSEQALLNLQSTTTLSAAQEELLQKYEEARTSCIDPQSPGFIDLSNFADTDEYDQKVKGLISAYSAIEKHNDSYSQMKKNLKYLSIVCWFPIAVIVSSLLLHIGGYIFFRDADKFNTLVQYSLAIGIVLALPTLYFYIRYMTYVRRADSIRADEDE